MKTIFISVFLLSTSLLIAQQDIYISQSGNMRLHPGAGVAVFGDIINDAQGGLNHSGLSAVWLFRAAAHGTGNSRIYDGPNATGATDNYNANGSYVRFFNLFTNNTTGTSSPSGTLINTSSGSGQIQIEQEVRICNLHLMDNGMI